MKKLIEKMFGHRHVFVFVDTISMKPLPGGKAAYTELYRCECGKEKKFVVVGYL